VDLITHAHIFYTPVLELPSMILESVSRTARVQSACCNLLRSVGYDNPIEKQDRTCDLPTSGRTGYIRNKKGSTIAD
jgi:hypothetical protein